MSYESDDYVYIDENHRLGWGYDGYADNPATWGNVVVVPRPQGYWNRSRDQADAAGKDWLDLDGAYRRFSEGVSGRDHEPAIEATVRFAKIFCGVAVVYDSASDAFWYLPKENRPDSWGTDWLEQYHGGDLAKAEAAVIDGEISTYRQWAQGEVYYVYGQVRRIESVKVSEARSAVVLRTYERDDWETTDSLHGIYQDGYGETFEDMVKAVAKENFGAEYTAEVN